MPYSEFTLGEVVRRFALQVDETRNLFANVSPITPGQLLTATLAETAPLALAMRTEKARSELVIAPILLEVRRLGNGNISLFSGAEFNVDPAEGLNGACDFLLTRSPHQIFIESPVCAIVEAKREDLVGGMGQCAAAMVAASRFNERDGKSLDFIYGAVTTGDVWKFLQLSGDRLFVDAATYYLNDLTSILGALLAATAGQTRTEPAGASALG